MHVFTKTHRPTMPIAAHYPKQLQNENDQDAHQKQNRQGVPGWLGRLSVQLLILAQVMISRFQSSGRALGSMLTAQNLLRILSPFLSAPPLLTLSLSLSK